MCRQSVTKRADASAVAVVVAAAAVEAEAVVAQPARSPQWLLLALIDQSAAAPKPADETADETAAAAAAHRG